MLSINVVMEIITLSSMVACFALDIHIVHM
jgi:hypothetical protein